MLTWRASTMQTINVVGKRAGCQHRKCSYNLTKRKLDDRIELLKIWSMAFVVGYSSRTKVEHIVTKIEWGCWLQLSGVSLADRRPILWQVRSI